LFITYTLIIVTPAALKPLLLLRLVAAPCWSVFYCTRVRRNEDDSSNAAGNI